jgi:hypothetical protein
VLKFDLSLPCAALELNIEPFLWNGIEMTSGIPLKEPEYNVHRSSPSSWLVFCVLGRACLGLRMTCWPVSLFYSLMTQERSVSDEPLGWIVHKRVVLRGVPCWTMDDDDFFRVSFFLRLPLPYTIVYRWEDSRSPVLKSCMAIPNRDSFL